MLVEEFICMSSRHENTSLRLDADARIADKRPYWRYPNREDFFELQASPSRVDWPSREIDRIAKRADGLCVYVAQPMTLIERVIFNPRFSGVKYRAGKLKCWWRNLWT
jgi:hypothetical protein